MNRCFDNGSDAVEEESQSECILNSVHVDEKILRKRTIIVVTHVEQGQKRNQK